MSELPQGQFRITLWTDDARGVRGWLGPQDVAYGGVSGGWSSVERPRQRALSEWKGMQLRTVTFDFMFDAREVGAASSVSALVDRMEQFASGAQRVSSSGPVEYAPPPTVRLHGAGLRHTEAPWVISDLQWGRATLDGQGRVTRQLGTVTLLQRLDGPSFSGVDRDARPSRYRLVYSRRGDNLMMLALRYLGKGSLWPVLKRANPGIRDPRRRLPVRTRIRVPLR